MIPFQESFKGDILAGILFEALNPVDQFRITPEALADVFQYSLGSFFFQLDITTFWNTGKSPVTQSFNSILLKIRMA